MGIDLYKNCRLLDRHGVGTIKKEAFVTMLLNLPIGLDKNELDDIIEKHLSYDSLGNVDYLAIFARERYAAMVREHSGSIFEVPEVQE